MIDDIQGAIISHLIDFNAKTETFAYLKDFNTLKLVPLPHRNTLHYLGSGQKEDYLLSQFYKGTFTALDREQKITMWSTATGKILATNVATEEVDGALL